MIAIGLISYLTKKMESSMKNKKTSSKDNNTITVKKYKIK